jgi:hypothetical protein
MNWRIMGVSRPAEAPEAGSGEGEAAGPAADFSEVGIAAISFPLAVFGYKISENLLAATNNNG